MPKISQSEIIHKMSNEFRRSICLYPKSHGLSCSKKIISSHTIQKAKAISPLKNINNEVMTFHRTDGYEPKFIGWNKASTYNGFCGVHDKSIFLPIEDFEISPTQEQLFILAYRSFCHEFYQKSASLRAQPYIIESRLQGHSYAEQQEMLEFFSAAYDGAIKGQHEMDKVKNEIFDLAFSSKNYNDFCSLYIEFSGTQILAGCGAFTPDYDVWNNSIQNLYKLETPASHISINVLNEGSKIIFSLYWPKIFNEATIFVKSFLEQDKISYGKLAVEIAFGYIENVYFSDFWWNHLAPNEKYEIGCIAKDIFYMQGMPRLSFTPNDWVVNKVLRSGF